MEDRKQIPRHDASDSRTSQNSVVGYEPEIARAKKSGSSSIGVTSVELKRKRSGSGYAWSDQEMDVMRRYVRSTGTNLLTDDVICAISKELAQIGANRTKSAIKARFQSMRSKMGYSLLPNKTTNRPWTEKEKKIIRKYCGTRNWTAAHMELSAAGFDRKRSSVQNGGARLIQGTWRPVTVEESNDIREMHAIYPSQWTHISKITGIPKGKVRHHVNRLITPAIPPLPPAPWTPEEDSQLLANVAVHSSNWEQTKDDLVGRSVAACQRRFEKLTRYLWDEESSKALVENTERMLLHYGHVNWEEIAQCFEQRNAVMCEVRYRFRRDPTFT